jgi:hypothetical protein
LRQRALLSARLQSLALTLTLQLQQLSRCSARSASMESQLDAESECKEMSQFPLILERNKERKLVLDKTVQRERDDDTEEISGDDAELERKKDEEQPFESQQSRLELVLQNAQQMLQRYSRISLRRNAEYSPLYRFVCIELN